MQTVPGFGWRGELRGHFRELHGAGRALKEPPQGTLCQQVPIKGPWSTLTEMGTVLNGAWGTWEKMEEGRNKEEAAMAHSIVHSAKDTGVA